MGRSKRERKQERKNVMPHSVSKTPVAIALFAVAAAVMVHAQQADVDTVLTNGKIITVDNGFTIAQAVAIKGDRFVAVGTNQDIARLAGPDTRRIDLGGKAVIPGLIDAHAHLMRAAETWAIEVRFDDVDSRKQALDMVRAKAAALGPGKWVYNLGGWSYDQFADNRTPLTRAELDQAAPNNPVYLQFSRCCAFLNSRGVEAMGSPASTSRGSSATPPGSRRDASTIPAWPRSPTRFRGRRRKRSGPTLWR